jgi:hypothetical protein
MLQALIGTPEHKKKGPTSILYERVQHIIFIFIYFFYFFLKYILYFLKEYLLFLDKKTKIE